MEMDGMDQSKPIPEIPRLDRDAPTTKRLRIEQKFEVYIDFEAFATKYPQDFQEALATARESDDYDGEEDVLAALLFDFLFQDDIGSIWFPGVVETSPWDPELAHGDYETLYDRELIARLIAHYGSGEPDPKLPLEGAE